MSFFTSTSISAEEIRAIDWRTELQDLEGNDLWDLSGQLAARSRLAEEAGDETKALALALLSGAASLHMSSDPEGEPYTPMMVFHDRRTADLPDFEPAHVEALNIILPSIENTLLRARVGDVVWLRNKKFHQAGATAVDAYLALLDDRIAIQSAERHESPADLFRRAIRIAGALGGEKKALIHQRLAEEFDQRVDEEPSFETLRILDLIDTTTSSSDTDNRHYAERTLSLAMKAETERFWGLARDFHLAAARWYDRAEDPESKNGMIEKAAETYISEADELTNRGGNTALAAASLIERAIEALKKIPDTKEQREELFKRQLAYQHRAQSEMMTIKEEVNITQHVRIAQDKVSGKNLDDALFSIACIHKPIPITEQREEAVKSLRQHFFTAMFSQVHYNQVGNKVGDFKGHDVRSAEFDPVRVDAHVHRNLDFEYMLVSVGYILPALEQINLEHSVTADDMLRYTLHHPFIPTGREHLFARGLNAGLKRDFVVSSHLLIPQIENSIRHLLNQYGVVTTKKKGSGDVQNEQDLNTLLYEDSGKELEKILGEDTVFYLRSLLVEKMGANARNYLAHGMYDEDHFNQPWAIYLWWMVLRIIMLFPILVARRSEESNGGQNEEGSPIEESTE